MLAMKTQGIAKRQCEKSKTKGEKFYVNTLCYCKKYV